MALSMLAICAGEMQVNAYLLWEGGEALVIDAPAAEPVLAALRERGLTLRRILLTHGHFDHIDGVKALKDATGARVAIHALDAAMLTEPAGNLSLFMGRSCVQVPADEFLAEGDEIALEAASLRVLHTPGHSPGSVCFLTDGALYSGDTLFYMSMGRTDFPHSDSRAMTRSLARLRELPPETRVHPGHMGPTSIGFESQHNPYM